MWWLVLLLGLLGPAATQDYCGGAYSSIGPEQKRLVGEWFSRFSAVIKRPVDPAEGYDNLGRWALKGPGLAQFDLTLHKRFSIRDKHSLEFRAELHNILNHPNFANPVSRLNNALGTFTGAALGVAHSACPRLYDDEGRGSGSRAADVAFAAVQLLTRRCR